MSVIPFAIRFIKNRADKSEDDVLKITKVDQNVYSWWFRDSNDTRAHVITLQPAYTVNERLDTLLKMVVADTQPPKEIQVDVPGFPSVLINSADLSDHIPLIHECLSQAMSAWADLSIKPRLRAPSYEDDFADMPPLIPVSEKHGTHLFFD